VATKVVTGVTVSDGEVTGGTSVTATADGQVCVRRAGAVTFDTLAVGDVSGAGGGSVTSIALAVPAALGTVSGSPITTSGTLTFSLATQTANTVFAGPTSGGAAAPTFRALVAADIPSLDAAKVTSGTFAAARIPVMVASGASHAPGAVPDPPASAGTTKYLREDGTWTVPPDTNSGGTVTSVALAAPAELSVSGSPVTGSGTLTLAWASAAANKVFAAPDGSAGTPSLRLLVAADIPPLDTSKLTTGTLAESRGGTGNASYTKGDVLAASGATTLARVAASATDGDVLSADSTAAAGVSYQHPALQLFAYRVPGSLSRAGNRWHGPARLTPVTPGAAVAAAVNKLYAYPLFVPAGQTIYQVAVKQASFSIGGSFRVGVYGAASLTDPWPLALLWDSGSQSTGGGTLANMLAFTASLATVRGGLYWLVFVSDNATATYEPVSPAGVFPLFGTPYAGGSTGGCVRADFTFAALPTYFPTANRTVLGAADGDLPGVFVQFKSPYLLYDTFSDVDATALASHVMDYGGGWTAHVGTWEINSGKARQTNTTGGVMVATADSGSGDGTYEFDLTTNAATDFTAGIAFRFSDTSNWWRFFASSGTGNWRLIEHTASAGGTVRATYAVAPAVATTYHVKVVLAGTSISCYVDGTLAASFTSSAQQTNTRHGIYESRSAGVNQNTFDAFRGTA
jgi:hypothetical protein